MCRFFSFVMDSNGKIYYFDKKLRILLKTNKELNEKWYEPDSHASICHYFKIDEDKVNKYEYMGEKLNTDSLIFDLTPEMEENLFKFLKTVNLREFWQPIHSLLAYIAYILKMIQRFENM